MDLEHPGEHLIHVFNSTLDEAKEVFFFMKQAGDKTTVREEFVKSYLRSNLYIVSKTFKTMATFENDVNRRNELLVMADIMKKLELEFHKFENDEMDFFIENHNVESSTDIIGNLRTAKSRVFLEKP